MKVLSGIAAAIRPAGELEHGNVPGIFPPPEELRSRSREG